MVHKIKVTTFKIWKFTVQYFCLFFKLTGDATYEPIVFLKQPYLLRGSFSFGNKTEITKIVMENSTKVNFEIFADTLQSAKNAYETIVDYENCPKEVLKFSPPPQNQQCDQSVFQELTTIHDYGLNVTFHNVSIFFTLKLVFQFVKFFFSSIESRMA